MQYVFLAAMCVFAAIYAAGKVKGSNFWNKLFFKTAASVMFVLVAVAARVGADKLYYLLILAGLVCSLAGDVLLVFSGEGDKFFLIGLAVFLIAHICYTAAFFTASAISLVDLGFFAALLTIGLAALANMRLRFRRMKLPVYVYMAVLCAMAAKAVSLLFVPGISVLYAAFAAAGALLFAFSDLALAYETFYPLHQKSFGVANTLMYYAGQGLIALSVMLTVS